MERIEAIEAEINQILRTYRLLRSEQCGRLTADQIAMKDALIADRLEERDKVHQEIVAKMNVCSTSNSELGVKVE